MSLSPADLEVGDWGGEDLGPWRAEVAAWLAANVPAGWRERMTGATEEEYVALQREWFATLRAGGYAAPHWPAEWGGGGLSLARQIVLAEELARARAPHIGLFHIGLYHAAATVLHAGTDAQRAKYLPGILDGEVWCQGFSEPGAGSDLASLQTRARLDGDTYVVNGQKIWTTNAQHARWCLLLARTNPDAPKHRGISYFVLDMRASGLDVRPIATSLGEPEFCEVFLDDVMIHESDRIGAENEGWAVILRTLAEERGPHVLENVERLRVARATLYEQARAMDPDAAMLRELGALHADTEVLRLLCHRMLAELERAGGVGPQSSVVKVAYSELLARVADLGLRVRGLDAQLERPMTLGVHYESTDWLVDYLNSWAWTISGGSNEIQRTIIAERMLGLPRG